MHQDLSVRQVRTDLSFQPWRVLTMGFGHSLHDTYTAFLPMLLPVFIDSMGLTKAQAGLLAVFLRWPSLLQPFLGNLADKRDLRALFFLGPVMTGIMMSLLGIAPSYGVLIIMLLLAGLSSAAFHSVGPGMCGNLSGQSLGRGMSYWMVGGTLGSTLGPLAIGAVLSRGSVRGTPWLMLGGFVGAALLYLALRDVTVSCDGRGGHQSTWAMLRQMGMFLLPVSGIVIARSFAFGAMNTYLPTFLTGEGADLWFAGISLSVFEVAGMAGALLGGSLSDRFGRRNVLTVALAVTAIGMFLFLRFEGWIRFPLLMILGMHVASVQPVLLALSQEQFPQNRSMASGSTMTLMFLLAAFIVVILGAIADRWGMRAAFNVSAVMPAVGLPVAWFFLPRPRGQQVA